MDITRIAAISPVIRINSFKGKNTDKDPKGGADKKNKEFEKALNSKNER